MAVVGLVGHRRRFAAHGDGQRQGGRVDREPLCQTVGRGFAACLGGSREPIARGACDERDAVSRLLGIDLGEKRIGLAIADPGGPAMGLATLRRGPTPAGDAEALRRVIGEQAVSEVVVGLPLHASGDEGTQALLTRAWVEAVQPLIGLPVAYRDERLTSHLAERRLGPMKRGRSGGPPTRTQREAYRARVDREAAAIILQDELDARATTATDEGSAGDAQETTQ
jgi:putative Holliday junction resolvase